MAYIRVRDRKILEYMDNNYNVPKDWDKFIQNIAVQYNLIIKKAKGKCICTNCKHEFITEKQISEYDKCPYCKNKYQIQRSNLKHCFFENTAVLIDVVNSQVVIRIFDIIARYDKSTMEFLVSNVEYARVFVGVKSTVFLNERASKNMGYMYYKNIKKLFSNTEYKYSMIWDMVKHEKYCDIESLLKIARNKSKLFEMLIKAKLYNLVYDTHNFEKEGSFEQMFGVPKTFYPFMKKYNITYKQLKVLQLLKECNINKVKYLEKFSLYALEEIKDFIGLDKFIKYEKMHCGKIDVHMYKDYLKFAYFLGFDLKNKRYIYPDNLKQRHDELQEQFREKDNELINNMILNRDKELSHNTYQDKKYIVFPAPTLDSLIDESKQQNHCVRTYAKDYASGKCDIYFMRDVKKQDKSLVTIEVRKNKIIQKRIKNNKDPNSKQMAFLNEWEQNVLKKVA